MQYLSDTTMDIVSATVPALEAHGEAIVTRMYERLLHDAQIRSFFNLSHQSGSSPQHKALTGAILAYANNIREPQNLAAAIERIAQKHVALKIAPAHYEAVGSSLLAAIRDVLGDAASPEVLEAWAEAYWFLAGVLIEREKSLYADQATLPGGWSGWRDFVIAEKRAETDEITSFTLRPVDGAAVLKHRPGQYLTLLLNIDDDDSVRRTYSVSSAPNGRDYRITIKREAQGRVGRDSFVRFRSIGAEHQRNDLDETTDTDRDDDQDHHQVDIFLYLFVTHPLAPLCRFQDGDGRRFFSRNRLPHVVSHDDHAGEEHEATDEAHAVIRIFRCQYLDECVGQRAIGIDCA